VTDTWTTLSRTKTFGYGATSGTSGAGSTDLHPVGCPCPVCAGLHTFERPRFFAGQLLTEAELTLLESYMMDKHRLHNVHLHGWGVVCGLPVRCDDCGDGVIVESGYAIDPCGNDIVVPVTQRVDVLRLIQACAQQTAPACDPPRYEMPDACDNTETWCLTVKYREWNTRAVTPLGSTSASSGSGSCSCGSRGSGGSSSCSCGCAGSKPARPGWECTCGSGGSANVATCSCGGGGQVATGTLAPECEPSRTQELYEFGVCRSDGSCRDLSARLAGTFPAEALACLEKLRPILARHVTAQDAKAMGTVLLDEGASSSAGDGEALCAFYDAVLEIYQTDPMRTTCVLPAELSEVDCSPQGPNESSEDYSARVAAGARALVLLLVAYVRDCVCYHLMPPCPEPPCDDRVILACFTVRDGQVVDICNFDCRRYAGSFVSRNYWLPIGPLVNWVVGLLCCYPLLGRPKGRLVAPSDRLRAFLVQRRTSALRTALMKDDFALVDHWMQRLRAMPRSFGIDSLLNRTNRSARGVADGVNLSAYLDMQTADAVSALEAQKLSVTETRALAPEEAVPHELGLFPSAAAGDRLVAYERFGRVVAFGRDVRPVRRAAKKAR
jgi:hypothetical protein